MVQHNPLINLALSVVKTQHEIAATPVCNFTILVSRAHIRRIMQVIVKLFLIFRAIDLHDFEEASQVTFGGTSIRRSTKEYYTVE